jgi:hypothetical protein
MNLKALPFAAEIIGDTLNTEETKLNAFSSVGGGAGSDTAQ